MILINAPRPPSDQILTNLRMRTIEPSALVPAFRAELPMTTPSDYHAQRLSDNAGVQLALLATAVIMLIAIGWFYFQ